MVTLGPIEKLGTIWWFELFDVDSTATDEVATRLAAEMDRFNAAYSRFRSDSVVSVLNDTGRYDQPSVEFLELLGIATTAYQETNGVFNIAIGGRLEQTGYDAHYSFTAAGELPAVPALPSVLTVTRDRIDLALGARIDFGGFGKGYLIDQLARLLPEWGSHDFLINGGGDMYATTESGKPIPINLQHPINREQLLGSISLAHRGFAASSPYVRQWSSHEQVHHHLVGNDQAGATFVVAPTAVAADIWATSLAIDSSLVPPADVVWWRFDETSGLVRQGKAGE